MKPQVRVKAVEPIDNDSAVITYDFALGEVHTDLAVIAKAYDAPARNRHPYRGRYIEVTGTAPMLAGPLAEAFVRSERGEFDNVTTDNRLMRFFRKPLTHWHNRRMRQVG